MYSLQHGQGRCIHKDKLTDAIVEEMIGRVTNCKEEVQAVFSNMRSVHLSVRVYII